MDSTSEVLEVLLGPTFIHTHITKINDLVMNIVDVYEKFGHSLTRLNITRDRYCTSILVAKQLLEKYISVIQMLKANRKALPPTMKKTKERDKNSWSS